MTVDEFFRELEQLNVEFYEDDEGYIRKDVGDFSMCPITYLCYSKFGDLFEAGNFPEAAIKLELDEVDACNIANAADYHGELYRNRILKLIPKRNEISLKFV